LLKARSKLNPKAQTLGVFFINNPEDFADSEDFIRQTSAVLHGNCDVMPGGSWCGLP
jgi:hypothetical protein